MHAHRKISPYSYSYKATNFIGVVPTLVLVSNPTYILFFFSQRDLSCCYLGRATSTKNTLLLYSHASTVLPTDKAVEHFLG